MTKTAWTKKGLILVAALTVVNMMMVSYVFLGFKELSAQNTEHPTPHQQLLRILPQPKRSKSVMQRFRPNWRL